MIDAKKQIGDTIIHREYLFPNSPADNTLLNEFEIPQVGSFVSGWKHLEHGFHTDYAGTVGIFLKLDGFTDPFFLFPLGDILFRQYIGKVHVNHARYEISALGTIRRESNAHWSLPEVCRIHEDTTQGEEKMTILSNAFAALPHPVILDMVNNVNLGGKEERISSENIIKLINLLVLYDGIDISEYLSRSCTVHDDLVNFKDGKGHRDNGNILFGIPFAFAPWVDYAWSKNVRGKNEANKDTIFYGEAYLYNLYSLFEELDRVHMDELFKWSQIILLNHSWLLEGDPNLLKRFSNRVRREVEKEIKMVSGLDDLLKIRETLSDEILKKVFCYRILHATGRNPSPFLLDKMLKAFRFHFVPVRDFMEKV